MTTSSKSYHLGTAGTDTQLKTRKITTKAFAVQDVSKFIAFILCKNVEMLRSLNADMLKCEYDGMLKC